jgi:hypothetical protein
MTLAAGRSPISKVTSRAFFILTIWLVAMAGLPASATATPSCPALGPLGFGVTLTNPGDPLDGYLALITFDTAGPVVAGEMRPDGGDLRVSDAACNPLPFWVESGFNTAVTRVWVKVPSVPAGESHFYVHHGDLSLTRTNEASDVFGADIASLYTFTEGTGTVVHDWVGGHDLHMQGAVAWTSGPRDGTAGVTGFTSGRLVASDNGAQLGAGDFSVFVMVNLTPNDRTGATRGLIGNYSGDAASGWVLKMQGAAGNFMLLTNGGGAFCQAGAGNVPAGNWNMLGARRLAGARRTLFHNGAAFDGGCDNDTRNVDGSGPFEIGRSYGGVGAYAMGGLASMALVYRRAVSDQEASDLYRWLFPATPPTIAIARPSVPDPPVDVRVTVDEALVRLDWNAAPAGAPAEWFLIEVGTMSGLTDVLTHLTRKAGDVGLLPDGHYFLRVRAVNDTGLSAPSREVNVRVSARRPMAGPVRGLTATVAGDTVTLSWQRSTLGVDPTGYRLEVGRAHGTTDIGTFNLSASTSFTTTGVPPGVYSVRVRSIAPGGYSPPSQDVMFVVGGGESCTTAPAPPVLLTPVVADSTVSLSWAPHDDFPSTTGYRLHVGSAPGASDLGVFDVSSPATSFVAGAPAGTYYLRLAALNACGESPASNEQLVIVGSVLPTAPSGLTAQVSGRTVTLNWTAPPGGITGYVLEVGTSPGATDLSQAIGPTASSLTVNDVPPGTYVVRVRARNDAGTGPASDEVVIVVP